MFTGTYGDGVRIIPEEQHKATPVPEKTIPRVSGGPIGDLFQAILGGKFPPARTSSTPPAPSPSSS